MKSKYITKILLGLLVAVTFVIIVVILFFGRNKDDKLVVGYVMTGSITDEGWNKAHYDGILQASKDMDFKLITKENVLEYTGNCGKAVEQLVSEGAKVIILDSFNYADEIKDLIIGNYSNISFFVNAASFEAKNMMAFSLRMYQARYLAGIVAGQQTKNNKIGYVAAMKNEEVIRGIDAFTLGVRSVNPQAKVLVKWTGEWENKEKEVSAATELIDKNGIDVITYHQNQPYVIEVAERKGIYSVGYHQAFTGYSSKCLTSAVGNWKTVYQDLIKRYMQNNTNDKEVWLGIEKQAVGLAICSPEVSEKTKEMVEKAREKIVSGRDVFSDLIYDNKGNIRCDKNEIVSDDVLLNKIDWFVEGVEIYE